MRNGKRQMRAWFESIGIVVLAVLIVGGALGTVGFLASSRKGTDPVESRKLASTQSSKSGPTELSRKIAESFRRQRQAKPDRDLHEQPPTVETEKSDAVQSVTDESSQAEMNSTTASTAAEAKPKEETRTASEILRELSRSPKRDRGKSRSARSESNDLNVEMRRRADLIGLLYQLDPKRPQLPELLKERWLTLRDDPMVLAEREAASQLPVGDAIGDIALYVSARLAAEDITVGSTEVLDRIKALRARTKKQRNPWISELLGTLADRSTDDPTFQREIYQEIITLFPNSQDAVLASRRLAQLDDQKFLDVAGSAKSATDPRVGRIFEFAFEDAVTGEAIVSSNLRGRVIVVDFWATWCGPCVQSMPHMKELYAKYNPMGVEFIGVSLDRADLSGRQKLLSFVSENQIPWPQYHQKDKELSRFWEIAGIPSVFIVDQSGRVVSIGGNLDRTLSMLVGDTQSTKRKRNNP